MVEDTSTRTSGLRPTLHIVNLDAVASEVVEGRSSISYGRMQLPAEEGIVYLRHL